MAHSTLMGLMGRMAAYTGQEVTWDQAMNSEDRFVPERISWDMELPIRPMAIPGQLSLPNIMRRAILTPATGQTGIEVMLPKESCNPKNAAAQKSTIIDRIFKSLR